MNALEPLFARLARSTFRSRFRLGIKEKQYCWDKGAEVIDKHAADFIAQRLAPAHPANDGKQTPMRGHPVFIAQHIPLIAAVDRHISHVLKCLFSYNIHLVVFFSTPVSTVQKNVLQGRGAVYHQKLATLIWITFNDSAFLPAEDNHDR